MRVDYPREALRRRTPLRAVLQAAARAGRRSVSWPWWPLVSVAYARTPIPTPERAGLRRRPRSSTSTTARPRSAASASQNRIIVAARPGARPRAEGRARRRGPLVLRATAASRRPASRARSGTTCAAARRRAARRSPSSTRRTPTCPRSAPTSASSRSSSSRSSSTAATTRTRSCRTTSTRSTSAAAPTASRPRPQTYFGKDVKRAHRRRGRGPRLGDPVAAGYDPDDARRTGWRAGSTTSSTAWSPRAGCRRPSAPACRCPRPLAEDQKPKGGTNYFLMDTVRSELKAEGLHRPARSTSAACGSSRPSTGRRSARRCVPCARSGRRENAKGVHIGLSAVQPGTGAVVAMYGGRDRGQTSTRPPRHGSSRARRSSRSRWPAALEDDIGLRSRFDGNSPFQVPGTDAGGQQRVRPPLRLVRRPGQGHRATRSTRRTST